MTVPQRYTLNRLLAALPPEDYSRISPLLTLEVLKARQVLQKRDEALRQIYFPSRSLCSLILTTADGVSAEIAVVGSEGLIGVEAALGLTGAMCDATVQVTGEAVAHSMTVDAFHAELELRGALHDLVRKYAQAFVGFIAQSVACNALHAVEARCCRWLLHADDRLGGGAFPLTHELLSNMLGVRRPTVTLVMTTLAHLGIVSTSRGMVQIVNREALEVHACGCYGTVKSLFDERIPRDNSKHRSEYSDAWQQPVVLTS